MICSSTGVAAMRMRGVVGFICLLVGGVAGPALGQSQFAGQWTGTYHCNSQPEATMSLQIEPSDSPLHDGVFSFDVAGAKGSYAVMGRVQDNGQFTIIARDWIDKPAGFSALGLSGRIGADGQSMNGLLSGCSGGFAATRPPSAEELAAAAQPMRLPEGDATPPEAFGGAIGGALATAVSAEAQCRALGNWYAPSIGPGGFDGMASDQILEAIAPLFLDAAFEPVFGVPYALLDQQEGGAIGYFVAQVCYGPLGMEPYRNVFSDVFRSPIFAERIAALNERAAEAEQWSITTREELAAIRAAGPEALGRLSAIEADIALSRLPVEVTEVLSTEVAALRAELEVAARDSAAAQFLADLDTVGDDFDQGHLGTALRVADEAQVSDMSADQVARVVQAAQRKAEAILQPPLAEAAAMASDLPAGLEGLRRAHAALNRFEQYRESMERTFGSIDPGGILMPLYDRLTELEADPVVLAELKAALATAVQGERPREAVEILASQVSGRDGMSPDIAALVGEALDQAEIAAIVIEDRSTGSDASEPTAHDIAAFALQRVREASARMAEMDRACTSGEISDPVAALACLTNPAVWTGETGSGVSLLGITKLGCVPEAGATQFLCTFVQEIRIDIAGAEMFGADRWGDLTQNLTSGEAVDALFIRASDGGWSVVTGDLR